MLMEDGGVNVERESEGLERESDGRRWRVVEELSRASIIWVVGEGELLLLVLIGTDKWADS